jgi:transposase-like protein
MSDGKILFKEVKKYNFSDILAFVWKEKLWADSLELERIMIERHKCPRCKENLVYKGYSSSVKHFVFGVCEDCDYAQHFWTESMAQRAYKKKVENRRRLGKSGGIF